MGDATPTDLLTKFCTTWLPRATARLTTLRLKSWLRGTVGKAQYVSREGCRAVHERAEREMEGEVAHL